MNKPVGWPLACLLCICCAGIGSAQTASLATLIKNAQSAYQAKDYPAFLALEQKALALAPDDPRILYNVGCGEALVGHAAEAVRLLDKLIARGLDMSADKDSDFNNIHQSPEWKQFEGRLAVLRQPVVRSSTAFTLPDKGLMATSLAVDEQTGDTFISSARERKILKRTKDGVVSDFATQKDGLLAVSYLLIDPVRKQLIASVAAVPFMLGFDKKEEGKSGLCFFDLATGKLVRQVFLTGGAAAQHILNSSVIDHKNGSVFVIDAGTHEIYRLRRSSTEFELYVSSVVFPAPQSLAFSADESTMYVADYMDGIWAMEVLSIERRHLDAPPDVYLAGLDGITRVGDAFIGLQIGIHPNRVVRIRLDPKAEKISSVETLESNLPVYSGPTQGVITGGDYLYIANSQIALADPTTGVFALDKANPTTVLRLPLGK